METSTGGDGSLHRTPSRTSTASGSSHSGRSGTVRNKPRKQSLGLSRNTGEVEDKSLTSFPSLPADASPSTSKKTGSRWNPLSQQQEQQQSDHDKTPLAPKRPRSIVDTLTTNSPSFRGRSALFSDSPASTTHEVPGAIHQSSEEHIRQLIARTGAVALVRQLAEDLAIREAEITRFWRRAEARERELKKMLRQVEVSNLDIESRLQQLDQKAEDGETEGKDASAMGRGKRRSLPGADNVIGQLMEEAFEDDLGIEGQLDQNYMGEQAGDRQATLRATLLLEKNGASWQSSQETTESRQAGKGWKDYLWSGTGTSRTSRASSAAGERDEDGAGARHHAVSNAGNRRKGLDETLFQPPTPGDDAGDRASISSKSDKRIASTSWTMKLFAGNSQGAKEGEGSSTVRGRANSAATRSAKDDSRGTSQASARTTSSAAAALMKVSGKTAMSGLSKAPLQPLKVGPTGAAKSSAASTHAMPPGSPVSLSHQTSLGPVEMDAILPHGSRPPTLSPTKQNLDDPADFLTDRFGFIYDQRRRKREADSLAHLGGGKVKSNKEMLSSSKDSGDADSLADSLQNRPDSPMSTGFGERAEDKSSKRWQDYLKIATFPTELLSQTPSSSNIMTLGNADIKKSLKRMPTFGESRDNITSAPNPLPAASSITASNAEIASPMVTINVQSETMTPSKGDFEPVRLLLSQLTELHDNLQREKTVKWNEFLRKVHAERRKEGEAISSAESRSTLMAADMPETSLADGEMIGIATLGNKGKGGRAKYREFKSLVLAGIPIVYRAKVWAECSGASALRIPGYYDDLASKSSEDDPIIVSQIQMDINRTLTDNVFFRKGPGVSKLNEVLLAYARRNLEVGYCQGMNLITASLLLIMPTAEDAFWILTSMIENILPRHYYDNSLLTSRADQQVLRSYVSELLPRLSAHLEDLAIELEALTFQWFLSLFTDCLSAEALYRVWDVLLCTKDEEGNGGSTFLFQVALALLKLNEAQLVACESPGEVYAYLGGSITNHAISIDGLIRASEGLKGEVRRGEVEIRRKRFVQVEEETIRERERIRKEGGGGRLLRSGGGDGGKGKDKNVVAGGGAGAGGGREPLDVLKPMPVES